MGVLLVKLKAMIKLLVHEIVWHVRRRSLARSPVSL
jgi:hypothetical protein